MELFERDGKRVSVLYRMEVLSVKISYRRWQGVRHTVVDVKNVTSSQCSWSLPLVLDLFRMELFSLTAANMVVCFAFGTKTVLIAHQ